MRQVSFLRGTVLLVSTMCLSLALCFGIMAWTEPGNPPPQGNVVAPLNTGAVTQTKAGGLNIVDQVGVGTISPDPNAKLDVNGNARANRFCLGSGAGEQCCNSWAACKAFTCAAGTVNGCMKCNAAGSGWTDTCAAGKFCVNGSCQVVCENPCSFDGEKSCKNKILYTCSVNPANGCLISTTKNCSIGCAIVLGVAGCL